MAVQRPESRQSHLLGTTTATTGSLAVVGGLIGAVSFTGSIIAFLKLQGWMRPRPITFPGQHMVNMLVLALAVVSGVLVIAQPSWIPLSVTMYLPLFFVLSLGFGLLMTLPIGGADMPVVISMYNAFTGLAVALDGFSFATPNYAMVVAGIIVGAAGSLLTLNMARAMNRSLSNVFFGAFGATEEKGIEIQGSMKSIEADDVAVLLAYADKVIIAPGYGMAVAQAQQKVKELDRPARKQEHPGEVRYPPGCRADARAHECPSCRGRDLLRPPFRPG